MDHFRSLIYPYELDEDAPLVRCRFSAGTSLGRQPAVRPGYAYRDHWKRDRVPKA
jgi:hypothetical protein